MNVLMIANQFPPMGGSGVQRTSKFVKYMKEFGYLPIILTRDDRGMSLKDESLLADIPAETPVIKTRAYDAASLKGVMRIPGKVIAKYVLVPDSDICWAKKSYSRAINLIDKYNIKIIYSTSYPYSDHLLALKIKRANPRIKWVADFRDEWTNNPYTKDNPHNRIRTKIEKMMEQSVLNEADALISNTPVMVKNFIEQNNLKGDNFYCIPNGYDKEDFEGIKKTAKPVNGGRFTLTYTGALYGRRKPDTFFKAVSRLIETGAVCANDIAVNFIGNYNEKRLNDDINAYGLKGIVNVMPYMPHKECIKKLYESDCLLLIEGQGPGAEAFYTGKIFEYMMAETPVLAIIPKNGAAASLINQTSIGSVAEFSDVDEIKSAFMLYYNGWKNGDGCYAPNYSEIAKYERKELTRMLCGIFDKLAAE